MGDGPTDKTVILEAIRKRLEQQVRVLTESQQTTQAGAAHEESRAEHPKDTRSTEASYLARGLAERVAQLRTALGRLAAFAPADFEADDPVALGALVVLEEEDGRRSAHILVPAAGGEKLNVGGDVVHALTPSSPMGQALIGRHVHEDVEVDLPRGRVTSTIVSIR